MSSDGHYKERSKRDRAGKEEVTLRADAKGRERRGEEGTRQKERGRDLKMGADRFDCGEGNHKISSKQPQNRFENF